MLLPRWRSIPSEKPRPYQPKRRRMAEPMNILMGPPPPHIQRQLENSAHFFNIRKMQRRSMQQSGMCEPSVPSQPTTDCNETETSVAPSEAEDLQATTFDSPDSSVVDDVSTPPPPSGQSTAAALEEDSSPVVIDSSFANFKTFIDRSIRRTIGSTRTDATDGWQSTSPVHYDFVGTRGKGALANAG